MPILAPLDRPAVGDGFGVLVAECVDKRGAGLAAVLDTVLETGLEGEAADTCEADDFDVDVTELVLVACANLAKSLLCHQTGMPSPLISTFSERADMVASVAGAKSDCEVSSPRKYFTVGLAASTGRTVPH